MINIKTITDFVDYWIKICVPDNVHYCDGTFIEQQMILSDMVNKQNLIKLSRPNSYLICSNQDDVARTEGATFICTKNKDIAGCNNNWVNSDEMYNLLHNKFNNVMKGKTMYIIPFRMGSDALCKYAIQITDSPYVVVSMYIMAFIDPAIFNYDISSIIKCVHSVGNKKCKNSWMNWDCDNNKYISHFIQDDLIMSYGSGYGGNSLLGKKSISLRLASYDFYIQGDKLAEHMLILSITNPHGIKKYILAAFPSSCGKTNLAMIKPNSMYKDWKIEVIGDDIAWIFIKNNRLYAINPERGFFGVATGTTPKTNPHAVDIISHSTIFTNVGYNKITNDIWWDGLYELNKDDIVYDWKGNITDENNRSSAAHLNSRFTSSLANCKILANDSERNWGVPIDAIIFGGRRSDTIPLIREAKTWQEGIYYGMTLSSEKTSATTDGFYDGNIRYDPFAMLPFCGYDMGDYFNYWLQFKEKNVQLPKIYSVNWFNKNNRNEYIWPGFSENMRILEFIFNRIEGTENNIYETPIGYLPRQNAINLAGLKFIDEIASTLTLNKNNWLRQLDMDLIYLKRYKKVSNELLLVGKNALQQLIDEDNVIL